MTVIATPCTVQYDVALCYSQGNGVEKDEEKAFEWFNRAAGAGAV